MKEFIGGFSDPHFSVTDEEKKQIKEIRQRLFSDLVDYQDYEREELLSEVENFSVDSIKIEILERHKMEVFYHLAFNSYYYEKDCFHLSGNGHIKITEDTQLLYSFINGYQMLAEERKGIAVARNIIKAKLIEFIIKAINTKHTEPRSYRHPIFKTEEGQMLFEYCLKNSQQQTTRRFLSYLYSYLKNDLVLIKGTQYQFAQFWNNNYPIPEIPLYPKTKTAGLDTWDGRSNHIIEEIKELHRIFNL